MKSLVKALINKDNIKNFSKGMNILVLPFGEDQKNLMRDYPNNEIKSLDWTYTYYFFDIKEIKQNYKSINDFINRFISDGTIVWETSLSKQEIIEVLDIYDDIKIQNMVDRLGKRKDFKILKERPCDYWLKH